MGDDWRPRWWEWPHLLSLDAVVVALAWQWHVAGLAGVALPVNRYAILGLAVWGVYLADRVFDTFTGGGPVTARHRFSRRGRRSLLALAGLALAGGVAVAAGCLGHPEFLAGLALAGVVGVYLLAAQRAKVVVDRFYVKEILVGVLFAAGVALFPLLARPGRLPDLAGPVGLFAAACALNCVLITRWERRRPVWGVAVLGAALAGVAWWVGSPVGGAATLTAGLAWLVRSRRGRRAGLDWCLACPPLILAGSY